MTFVPFAFSYLLGSGPQGIIAPTADGMVPHPLYDYTSGRKASRRWYFPSKVTYGAQSWGPFRAEYLLLSS